MVYQKLFCISNFIIKQKFWLYTPEIVLSIWHIFEHSVSFMLIARKHAPTEKPLSNDGTVKSTL